VLFRVETLTDSALFQCFEIWRLCAFETHNEQPTLHQLHPSDAQEELRLALETLGSFYDHLDSRPVANHFTHIAMASFNDGRGKPVLNIVNACVVVTRRALSHGVPASLLSLFLVSCVSHDHELSLILPYRSLPNINSQACAAVYMLRRSFVSLFVTLSLSALDNL